MTKYVLGFLCFLCFFCQRQQGDRTPQQHSKMAAALGKDGDDSIIVHCTDSVCIGTYKGPEFDQKEEKKDVAHQFSNTICKVVGAYLKKKYLEGKFAKVDLEAIEMSTFGMNNGDNFVEYSVKIPFIKVRSKCEARTAFDHAGGWNHYPSLDQRKSALLAGIPGIVVNRELEVSKLKKTKEGLMEFWIQWKHANFQSDCE
jgi:hypothetical protein